MDDKPLGHTVPQPRMALTTVAQMSVPEASLMIESDDSLVWNPVKQPVNKVVATSSNTPFRSAQVTPHTFPVTSNPYTRMSIASSATYKNQQFIATQGPFQVDNIRHSEPLPYARTFSPLQNRNNNFHNSYDRKPTSGSAISELSSAQVLEDLRSSSAAKILQSAKTKGTDSASNTRGGTSDHKQRGYVSSLTSNRDVNTITSQTSNQIITNYQHAHKISYGHSKLNQHYSNSPSKVRFMNQTSNSERQRHEVPRDRSSESRPQHGIPRERSIERLPTGSQDYYVENKENIDQNNRHNHQSATKTSRHDKSASEDSASHRSSDTHIYKLIEGQNQQILHLQKVLEKVLDKQMADDSRFEELRQTPPQYKVDNSKDISSSTRDNKKIAIVQTSFIEKKPETKSIAVNTDISWDNLVKSIHDSYQQKPPNSQRPDCQCRTNCREHQQQHADHYSATPKNNRTDGIQKSEIIEHAEMEMSVMMRGVVVSSIQDNAPSPEPPIVLDDPIDSDCSDNEPMHRPLKHAGHEVRFSTVDHEDSPVLGESASMYEQESPFQQYNHCTLSNKRNQAEAYTTTPTSRGLHNEPEAEDTAGVTIYNVLGNINRVIGTTGNEDYSNDTHAPHQEREVHRDSNAPPDRRMTRTDEVYQQLQNMGISFIDPSSVTSNQRPIDSIFMPDIDTLMSLYRNPTGNLEATLTPYSNTHPTKAAVAKYLHNTSRQPGTDPRERGSDCRVNKSSSHHPQLVHDEPSVDANNFSTSTKHFLRKYNLD